MKAHWRAGLLWLVVLGGAVGMFLHAPIPQDPAYHRFVDARAFFGLPNALNVLSNVPFLIVGFLGFRVLLRRGEALGELWERRLFWLMFAGITLTAFGSGYYHLAPDDSRLVWDRLPMTLVFMPLFAAILGERIAPVFGRVVLWPLLVTGVASVFVWRATDDLRLYALVQFIPLVLLPLLLLLYPAKYTQQKYLWWMIGCYVAAKLLEIFDAQVWGLGHLVSGHTVKHLAAGVAIYQVVRLLERRERVG